MSDPRRIILLDQHPWTFTRSTISYEAPSWFLLLGRIVIKVWDLSPMQRLKFLLPHSFLKYIPNAKVYSKAQREDRQPWRSLATITHQIKPSQDIHCHNKQAQLPMLQTLSPVCTGEMLCIQFLSVLFLVSCWHIIGIGSATVVMCVCVCVCFFFFSVCFGFNFVDFYLDSCGYLL